MWRWCVALHQQQLLQQLRWQQRASGLQRCCFASPRAQLLYYTSQLPNFKLPVIYKTVFLGWNFNYNTQVWWLHFLPTCLVSASVV
jgi:hypothetical protein